MKQFLPYIFSLIVGAIFGYLIFQDVEFDVKSVFAENLTVTAFQLGVFNNEESALEMKNKYAGSIVMPDDDVFRVYYSFLTDEVVIEKMKKYLTNQNISFYLKTITLSDEDIIKSINEYENTMKDGSDNVLTSINTLMMSKYKGEN